MDQGSTSIEEFVSNFTTFRDQPEVVRELMSQARRQKFPAQTHLYWEGDACSAIAFLFDGQIRVYKSGESGREITLYEIGRGETCILNASCILGNNAYPANAVTTAPVDVLLVPAHEFSRILKGHEALRSFVFSLLSSRLTEVMELVDEVAFGRMDERLMDYLIEKSADGVLCATHQKIANDLGSSREVISRLLKELERQEKVALSRNSITLLRLQQ
jgi:CRP/FNR family transcriptional regulator